MATTTDLTTLKINYLTQAQYDNALANNQINSDELYFTPADNGVTLNVNGQSTSSPSFYAPTNGGTANTQALVSGGTATAPSWVDINPSITVTAGTSSATPKVNVTVLGQSGTAQSITQATTGVYGATKLSSTASSTEEGLAATPKGVNTAITNAINALDYTNSNGAVNKTPTSIIQTDGKIAVIYSDIGSLNASVITSGTLPTAQGGTGNTSYTANRMIYSESTDKLSASGHYASSDKIAINSTSAPTENFYVEGTSRFSLGTSNTSSAAKKFIIGSSDTSYLSFGNTGIQAYDDTDTESTLNLNYFNGNIQMGRSSDSTTTNLILFGTLYLRGSAASATKPGPGKISWYGSYGGNNNYTWYDYVSNATDGMCPTGGKPSTPENVTAWAKRSLITGAQNHGWVWEAAANEAAASTETQPTAIFSINSGNGRALLNTSCNTNNYASPSFKIVSNTSIADGEFSHGYQFLVPNLENGGGVAGILFGKRMAINEAAGLLFKTSTSSATDSTLSLGFVNNNDLLLIKSNRSVRINDTATTSDTTTELRIKGRVVVDTSYHSINSFSEFRINRSTGGWSAITLGGAQGTTSGAGLGVWLIGNKNTPQNATTAASSITDSQFYISYNGSTSAPCRIQGHNADGFSIRPRLAVNANVNTDYSLYVNGTSLFFGRVISNTVATDAIVVEHSTANRDAGVTVRRKDTGTAVWMGVGASEKYGLYSPVLTSWMIYGDNSGVYVNGNAATATAANRTTTTNAIAYYTDTTGTFGSKASANGALYATAANGALQWGTLPVGQGGTGATSFTANSVIVSGSTTTAALTTRAITNNTSNTAATASTNIPTMNTLYYTLAKINNADQTHATSIYAPTAGGTAGRILKSQGATSTPAWSATTSLSESAGTTTTNGTGGIILGNATASGTANNARGFVRLYGTGTRYHNINPASTASTSNYDHYLPNSTGWIATGGNGTSTGVGSASQPVYLSSAGVLTACQIQAQFKIIEYTGTGAQECTINFGGFAAKTITSLNTTVTSSLGGSTSCALSEIATTYQYVQSTARFTYNGLGLVVKDSWGSNLIQNKRASDNTSISLKFIKPSGSDAPDDGSGLIFNALGQIYYFLLVA